MQNEGMQNTVGSVDRTSVDTSVDIAVLGHRGSRRPGPENTLAAVMAALSSGAAGVEIDVRRGADGVLVCVHDAQLPSGLAVLSAGTDDLLAAGVPSLVEVLDAAHGRGRVIIEIKNVPGEPDFDAPLEASATMLLDLLAARRAAGSADDVLVSSFDWFAIERVRDGGWPTGFLVLPGVALSAATAYAGEAGHQELHPTVAAALADPEGVLAARAAGLAVVCWTGQTVAEVRALAAIGVEGVICDDPAEILTALRGG